MADYNDYSDYDEIEGDGTNFSNSSSPPLDDFKESAEKNAKARLYPLKFHSQFYGTQSTVDDDFGESNVGDVTESMSSVPDEPDGIYTSQEYEIALPDMNSRTGKGENGLGVRYASTLNRGLLKEDLRIEVPRKVRRFTDGGSKECDNRSVLSGPSTRLLERVPPHRDMSMRKPSNLGTPSRPPIFDIGEDENKSDALSEDSGKLSNVEQTTDDEWRKNELGLSPCYDASGQDAWQKFLAYDACIRLCINASARGCTESQEFLRDDCYLLRNSFGLHKLLLHQRGKQPLQRSLKFTEQVVPSKMKKVVEVKKGPDFVKQVSLLMKSGINSLKLPSFRLTSEDTTPESGPIVETLAYDLLLEAGLRAQHFQARNLSLSGPWNWLLTEFAEYYTVYDSYTKLRYLSYVS